MILSDVDKIFCYTLGVFVKHLKCTLYSIFFIGVFIRVLLLCFLPRNATNLAPDEEAYAGLTYWVANGLDVRDFPAHGSGLYERTRTYILFSTLFYRIGFDQYTSTRLTSLLFFTCMSYMLLRICTRTFADTRLLQSGSTFSLILMFAFMNLLPSYILWSGLAIRETTSHFFLFVASLTFSRILLDKSRISLYVLIFILSVTFGYGVRAQSVWILLFCFFICSWLMNINFFRKLGITILLTFSFITGIAWTSDTSYLYTNTHSLLPSSTTTSTASTTPAENPETSDLPFLNSFTAPIRSVSELDERRINNQQFAASAISPPSCINSGLQNLLCQIGLVGYQLISFLFRPFPLLDSGSNLMLIASLENIIWLALFFLLSKLILNACRTVGIRFLLNDYWVRFTFFFLATFTLSASMYFGNLGTGFRHKSTLIWAISLLVIRLVHLKNKSR